MTWIQTIPKSAAGPEYREALDAQHAWYPREYAAEVPGLPTSDADGIVAALSLIPHALHHGFATFGALMDPSLPLNRRQHELIATVVSRVNCTRYCSVSHQEFLARATGDPAFAKAVADDFRSAPLTEAEQVMCEHAERVTRNASAIQPADIAQTSHNCARSAGTIKRSCR